MKKLYLVCYLVLTAFLVQAQKKQALPHETRRVKINHLTFPQNGVAAACDKLNFPVPAAWGAPKLYTYDSKAPIDSGFITGTNFYDDVEKAQYFDASSTSDNYITEAYVGFGIAYSSNPDVVIPIHVYDGTTGVPKKLLGTANVTMKTISDDVTAGNYTDIIFSPAITLPASKKFFVSVDLSNLEWFKTPSDTLAIYSSVIDQGTGAWERYYTSATATAWASFPDNYSTHDAALYIHPFLSAGLTCGSLPVHLLSFDVEGKNKNVVLNWKVAQEYNMSSYTVERATGTDYRFEAAGTVAATNSNADHSYSFTDANALSANTILYYRLKQTNSDGKSIYSNVLTIEPLAGAVDIKVTNPFKNAIQLQVNTPYAQKMQGGIYDMLGRRVATAPDQVLATGQNTVTIPAASLPKGMYILNVTVGKTTYKYKIIN